MQRRPDADEDPSARSRVVATLTLLLCVAAAASLSWISTRLLPQETEAQRDWEEQLPAPGSSPTALPARPAASVQETPAEWATIIPAEVGGFVRESAREDPDLAESLRALEAATGRFSGADGHVLTHHVFRYGTAGEAGKKRVEYTSALETVGYITLGATRSRGGGASHVAGEHEILVWSNGPLLAILDGPPDITREVFLRFPY